MGIQVVEGYDWRKCNKVEEDSHKQECFKHVDKAYSQAEASVVHWNNRFELHVMEL